MTPNYVAKKSVISSLNIFLILFAWLIIPAVIQVVRILDTLCYRIEFYDEKVVRKSGILTRRENQTVFGGVYAVSITKTLIGRIFDYGNVQIDCPGRWDIDTSSIKNPEGLRDYLEKYISARTMTSIVYS